LKSDWYVEFGMIMIDMLFPFNLLFWKFQEIVWSAMNSR